MVASALSRDGSAVTRCWSSSHVVASLSLAIVLSSVGRMVATFA